MSGAIASSGHGLDAGESSGPPQRDTSDQHSDESEVNDDPVAISNKDDALLEEDPLGDLGNGFGEPVSFKRKLPPKSKLSLSHLFSTPLSSLNTSTSDSTSVTIGSAESRTRDAERPTNPTTAPFQGLWDGQLNDTKEDVGIDWNIEGPGRRVGYEDLSTIDWIFEYAKERQRLRILRANTPGLTGYFRRVLDASKVWMVLVLTGIAVGILAAGINVAGDWLGDLKTGYCRKGDGGGKFYLNKSFCCWGHDSFTECEDWRPWREALRISDQGGGYVVELIFYVLYSAVFAAAASILVKQYAFYAKHSGIPEIKTVLGGFVIRHFMGAWTLIIKSLGLCLSVASGLWAGKEGPLIHVACCCANLIMKPFDSLSSNEARKREILSAAAAAGISVAFGSPIGGVLFSLEQLSYYFPDKTMWQSFVCAMVAAVTLQFMNPFRTGKIVLYEVRYSSGWHDFELIPFVFLGVLGGLYGGLFIKANMLVAKFRKSSKNLFYKSPVVEVLVIAFASAVINFPNIFMRAQLSELVYNLFAECAALGTNDPYTLCKTTTAGNISIVTLLLSASALGSLLAAITFGLMLPAGIILPSLAIGALYGRALGIFMQLLRDLHPSSLFFSACEPDIQCVTPGTYAIVGAASALAGVTRMTVSIVVIMFELTGALTYVLPIMIAVMLSKWIGDAISPKGIYESWIQFNGYPFIDNHDDRPAPDIPASNIMTRYEDLICLSASPRTPHTISSLLTYLSTHPYRGYPVISSPLDPILLGYIPRPELQFALNMATCSPRNLNPQTTQCFFTHIPNADPNITLDLRPWMDQTPITLNANASFSLAKDMFQRLGVRWLAFVERGRLRGLVTKKDVWFVAEGTEGLHGRGFMGAGFVGGANSTRVRRGHQNDDYNGNVGDEVEIDDVDGEGRGLLRDEDEEENHDDTG